MALLTIEILNTDAWGGVLTNCIYCMSRRIVLQVANSKLAPQSRLPRVRGALST
jgi:hypothetical protein